MPFAPEIARKMRRMLLFAVLIIVSSGHALAWKDGELLIWISDNRGYRALVELGQKFEKEFGVSVEVQTQDDITNKFQAAY